MLARCQPSSRDVKKRVSFYGSARTKCSSKIYNNLKLYRVFGTQLHLQLTRNAGRQNSRTTFRVPSRPGIKRPRSSAATFGQVVMQIGDARSIARIKMACNGRGVQSVQVYVPRCAFAALRMPSLR